MRVLVTGAQGFVGRYMVEALRAALGADGEVIASARRANIEYDPRAIALDVTDVAAVDHEIRRLRPSRVIHLAGLSTIREAVENQALAWTVHLQGTLNMAHAVLRHAPQATLINVGSGQVYGATSRDGQALTESSVLAPTSIQMASKSAADLALGALAGDGLKCVRFRPFNHTGIGQSERFALPRFALQLARIRAGRQPPLMRVGNMDTERDFLDVRDVVSAYLQAVLKADELKSGEIFNVASGVPRRMGDILGEMILLSGVDPVLETDPSLVRPDDIPRFVGDAEKARRELNWRPEHDLSETLAGILSEWRSREAHFD